ncbi:MAG: MBOAT family protein [Firmicutes bacterium]|nr:MBOAT family protein [Bacillota bacterium]
MEFSTIIFLFIFFPIFLLTYFFFKKRSIRNLILFIFSIIFYAWGEIIYVFLVLISIIINYYLTKLINRNKNKKIFIFTIIFNLLILFIFKYLDFFINIINYIFNINIPLLNIALPIGISFYTFQMLSYIIDVYQKKVKFQNNIIYLSCYIIAFPQLIAGPIVRYETIEDELDNRIEKKIDFTIGVRRFIIGLSKKILIANVMGLIATNIFYNDALYYGFIGSWLGIIFYALQILYDFSGYSDMAIGIGKMLGFNYLENFDYPYISKSITEFWRRWHISLGTFFKDYVYIPLGGNRVSKKRFIANILIVWALTGLWHGASINFVLWGLFYGIILLIEKLYLKKYLEKLPIFIQHFYAIILILFGWVLFRSITFKEIITTFKALFGIYGLGNINLLHYINTFNLTTIFSIILAFIFTLPLDKKISHKYPFIWDLFLIILFIISLSQIIIGSYNPFIYFRF